MHEKVTHTHTHTEREREGEKESEKSKMKMKRKKGEKERKGANTHLARIRTNVGNMRSSFFNFTCHPMTLNASQILLEFTFTFNSHIEAQYIHT